MRTFTAALCREMAALRCVAIGNSAQAKVDVVPRAPHLALTVFARCRAGDHSDPATYHVFTIVSGRTGIASREIPPVSGRFTAACTPFDPVCRVLTLAAIGLRQVSWRKWDATSTALALISSIQPVNDCFAAPIRCLSSAATFEFFTFWSPMPVISSRRRR